MTDIHVTGSRKALLALANQLTEAIQSPNQYGRVETTFYAKPNSTNSNDEIRLTFSNEDSEETDGGYQGDTIETILVDIDTDWS